MNKQIRIILLASMILAALAFSLAPNTDKTVADNLGVVTVYAADVDCDTLRLVCKDMWLVAGRDLCVAMGGDPAQCYFYNLQKYRNCVIDTSEWQCNPNYN